MIVLPEIDEYRERYAGLKMEPLKITLVYKTGTVRQNYDSTALDGLLGSQVVRRAVGELPTVPECYDIPLPLTCLWRNEHGWPLWAATYFWPESETFHGQFVVHKRAITGRWSQGRGKDSKLSINKAAGAHKEKRVPVPIEISKTGKYLALCIGNAEAIAELLESVVAVSGRRGIGFGEVKSFVISPLEHDSILINGNQLTRSIPTEYAKALKYPPSEPPVLVGWTPPQWKPSLFSYGWRAGTSVEIDYYGASIELG